MVVLNEMLLPIIFGILAVTTVDVFGSITSRKWYYNYALLTPLSFLIYTMIGYFVSSSQSLTSAILTGSLVGIYDGTIGWKIAIILNANMGSHKEAAIKTDSSSRIVFMIVVSTFFGFLGALIAGSV